MSLLPYILGELRGLSGLSEALAPPAPRRHSFHPYRHHRWADDADLDWEDLDELLQPPRPALLRLLSDADDGPRLLVARPARKRRAAAAANAIAAADKKTLAVKKADDDKHALAIDVDVQQFRPEELSVQVLKDQGVVVIEGRHEERHDNDDEHGFVRHHFSRRFKLPDGVDPDTVTSRLSADGTLQVTAPRRQALAAPKEVNVRKVPIAQAEKAALTSPAPTQDADKEKEKQAEGEKDAQIHNVD